MKSNTAIDVRSEKGFTLVELMVVVAIGAVLATLTVWGVATVLPRYRLNNAAAMLVGDLYRAKIMAVDGKESCRVVFNANGIAYSIDQQNTKVMPATWSTVVSRNISQDYPGVVVTGVTANPVFTPRGTTSDETITLGETGGGLTAVITITLAGRIKIQ